MAMKLIGILRTLKLVIRNAYFTLTSVFIEFEYLFYVHRRNLAEFWHGRLMEHRYSKL